jgi:hypothetical protein
MATYNVGSGQPDGTDLGTVLAAVSEASTIYLHDGVTDLNSAQTLSAYDLVIDGSAMSLSEVVSATWTQSNDVDLKLRGLRWKQGGRPIVYNAAATSASTFTVEGCAFLRLGSTADSTFLLNTQNLVLEGVLFYSDTANSAFDQIIADGDVEMTGVTFVQYGNNQAVLYKTTGNPSVTATNVVLVLYGTYVVFTNFSGTQTYSNFWSEYNSSNNPDVGTTPGTFLDEELYAYELAFNFQQNAVIAETMRPWYSYAKAATGTTVAGFASKLDCMGNAYGTDSPKVGAYAQASFPLSASPPWDADAIGSDVGYLGTGVDPAQPSTGYASPDEASELGNVDAIVARQPLNTKNRRTTEDPNQYGWKRAGES